MITLPQGQTHVEHEKLILCILSWAQ